MFGQQLCVGIDIGASAVKVCQLRKTKAGYALVHFGRAELPPETVVDGALMNSTRVVEVIQGLLKEGNVRNKRVALAVSGHSVIIKKIPLPEMTREELDKSIQWEAEQFIPFDMADVFIDAEIVSATSAQQGQMDVVLVAAKKDYVSEYTSVIVEAGLQPLVCDVDAFAVESMLKVNYDLEPGQTVVLVNIGASKTNVNILADGTTSFTRDLTTGGNNFTEEIQKQLNVSHEEAETLKHGDLHDDGVVPTEVHRCLQSVAETVTHEIHRSIDFYAATSASAQPSKIYLSGGSARLQILAQALQGRINVPVEVVDPFRRINITGHDIEELGKAGPAAAVAVGLALRFPGDDD